MNRTRRTLLIIVLGLACFTGCGGRGAIFLSVDAVGPWGRLAVPTDADSLEISVTSPDGKVELLTTSTHALTDATPFPVTLGLEPGPRTGLRVKIVVTLKKQDTVLSTAEAEVPMRVGEVTPFTIRLNVQ